MNIRHGDIWLADLNPIRGSEQAGTRPVLIFQNDAINSVTTTVIAIPLTTNLRRAALPSCVRVAQGEGGWHTTPWCCATNYGCSTKHDCSGN